MRRKIVQIDQEKCNGCGLCIPNCADGALKIINGKARLVSDKYCDGLGACLSHCPQDAIRIIRREAEDFDVNIVGSKHGLSMPEKTNQQQACPGLQVRRKLETRPSAGAVPADSQLDQWPIQLQLVPVTAPFFKDADILIAASCVPFSFGGFHNTLLAGRSLIIACPKLDNTESYLEKLTGIFKQNDIKSVTVAMMEVPCCQGLLRLVRQALKESGKRMSITVETITVKGERL
jgi:Pyruvate/2-oxoacid:ferredoxin oxidoreductase delta subunit